MSHVYYYRIPPKEPSAGPTASSAWVADTCNSQVQQPAAVFTRSCGRLACRSFQSTRRLVRAIFQHHNRQQILPGYSDNKGALCYAEITTRSEATTGFPYTRGVSTTAPGSCGRILSRCQPIIPGSHYPTTDSGRPQLLAASLQGLADKFAALLTSTAAFD